MESSIQGSDGSDGMQNSNKIQKNSVARDNCAIDMARHVVELRNGQKEVDAFTGIQVS